jgi:SOS response regulatory protein OraA/RecX
MKPSFTSEQEMYNYAANQMMNLNLSNETVKRNLMERGVSDAEADIVIQNMIVAIEKRKRGEGSASAAAGNYGSFANMQEMYNYAANQLIVEKLNQQIVKRNLLHKGVSDSEADNVIANMMTQIEKDRQATASTTAYSGNVVTSSTGSFPSVQEMYNYAADQLIVKKQSQQSVKYNLMNNGLSASDADVVIKNMMAEIGKNKPVQTNAKRSEGRAMLLTGLVVGIIGAILYGANFKIAGESFVVSYGLIAIGAIFFFRGLFKMF